MNKFTFLLCLFLGATVAWAQTSAPASVKPFESAKHKVKLEYPANWTVPPVEQIPEPSVFIALTPPLEEGKTTRGVLQVQVHPPDQGGATLEEAVDAFKMIAEQQEAGKNIKVTDAKLGDLAAKKLEYDAEKEGAQMHFSYTMAVPEKTLYMVAYITPKDQAAKHASEVEALLKSFKLTK